MPGNCLSDRGDVSVISHKSVTTSQLSTGLFCVKSAALVGECLTGAFFLMSAPEKKLHSRLVSLSLKNSFKPEILKTASGVEI